MVRSRILHRLGSRQDLGICEGVGVWLSEALEEAGDNVTTSPDWRLVCHKIVRRPIVRVD